MSNTKSNLNRKPAPTIIPPSATPTDVSSQSIPKPTKVLTRKNIIAGVIILVLLLIVAIYAITSNLANS